MKLGLIVGSVLPSRDSPAAGVGETDHGSPSSGIYRESAGENELFVIARHGMPPSIPPHMVRHRANVEALANVKPDAIISICSTGSLREDMDVPCISIPSDYVDFFSGATYHDDEIVHITPGLDPEIQESLAQACRSAGIEPVCDTVYVQMKGPRLETRSEIGIISGWGDLVGMNMAPEATLAREKGVRFGSILTVDNHAHGSRGSKPDFRDILKSARARWEDIVNILAFLEP